MPITSTLRSLLVFISLLLSHALVAQQHNFEKHTLLDIFTELPYHIDTQKPLVLFFLSPECPLCQNYTQTIIQLNQQYKSKIQFLGIFPGKAYAPDVIRKFAEKYALDIALYQDSDFELTRDVGATVTPSVALYNTEGVQYFGAIDNALQELGKKRVVVTDFYLKDAIESLLHHEPIRISKTVAKGCFINMR
ncbi:MULTISPECIES: redoxin domain-containing protein [Sphingobacterium]|uniref:Redoxin domain-containing protein n=1 Tax=Sphingobacterium populi TaxID=1812824 RepID=A0ABW5UAJ1_9SPHI|nr:redoxin domain-containing protein [Sphingobacterium sp. CFCC 11742]